MKYLNLLRKKVCPKPKTQSKTLINYQEYALRSKEKFLYYIISSISLFALALLFYRSFLISVLLCFTIIPLKKAYINYKIEKRKENLLEGYRDVLYSISGAIAAGRQMPQAISDAAIQMKHAYGENSDIYKELTHIDSNYLNAHSDIGDLLLDFAERSGLEEIKQFADSYLVCKRCGSDLEAVCLKSCSLLLDKIEYKNEVKSLIAQKKLDIILLTLMPIAVLILLNLISYSYIAVLYESLLGKIVMTICLLLIAISLRWSLKIIDLKI